MYNEYGKGTTYRERAIIKAQDNDIHDYWTVKDVTMFFVFVVFMVVACLGLIALNHITLGY